jgi:hypothetical protein
MEIKTESYSTPSRIFNSWIFWRQLSMKKLVRRKASGIEARIKPLEEVQSPVTMLAYGQSGTGKTVFGATFPKPLLLIDIREKGAESIMDIKGIDLAPVEHWDELDEVYWILKNGSKYKSVVLDQLTAAQAMGMSKLREQKGMKPSEPFSQRGWGQLSGMMQEMIYNYRELYTEGYNVLFNAHERQREPQEEDDERIAPSVGSNLMQSVASFLNGAVSVIGNTFIREKFDKKAKTSDVQYCMRVGPHAYYRAKIRRPVSAGPVPGVLVNPTFEKILAIQRGESFTRKIVKR